MSADIAWPYGATVHDFETLYAIHQRLKRENTGGMRSRYEIGQRFCGTTRVSPQVPRCAIC
jgi:hypothetical protein